MSDFNPKPKTGFTKSGKSLKAVRRYYAQKNADRQRSPKKSREEDNTRRRSPTDDKLSKRIAAELKVQADANEKRSRRATGKSSTDATSPNSPIIISPKETGPVFIAETPTKSVKSAKSIKSTKSQKSIGTMAQFFDYLSSAVNFGPFSLGYVFAAAIIGIVYIFSWILMKVFDSMDRKIDVTKIREGLPAVLYLAVVSIFVVLTCLFWLAYRNRFTHAVISLIVIMISTICIGAYIIYASVTRTGDAKQPLQPASSSTQAERDNLIFLTSITYFCVLLVTLGMMIKQVISLMYTSTNYESKNRTNEAPQMSVFLAPH